MGVRIVRDNSKEVLARIEKLVGAATVKAAHDIEAQAKVAAPVDTGFLRSTIFSLSSRSSSIAAAQSGRKREASGRFQSGKFSPDQMAQFDTSAVADAQSIITTRPTNAVVGVGANYAAHVEFGTTKRAPHPFLTPAMDAVRPVYAAALRKIVEKAG